LLANDSVLASTLAHCPVGAAIDQAPLLHLVDFKTFFSREMPR
jgi:hypothetical protein